MNLVENGERHRRVPPRALFLPRWPAAPRPEGSADPRCGLPRCSQRGVPRRRADPLRRASQGGPLRRQEGRSRAMSSTHGGALRERTACTTSPSREQRPEVLRPAEGETARDRRASCDRMSALGRQRWLGPAMFLPAILYVVALVGVPVRPGVPLRRRATSRSGASATTSSGLANFQSVLAEPRLPARAAQLLRLHDLLPDPRARRREHPGARAEGRVPGPAVRPLPHPAALGRARLDRLDRLEVDPRFALQRHQLGAHPAAPRQRVLARRCGSASRSWR